MKQYGYQAREEAKRRAIGGARMGVSSMETPSNKILPLHFQQTTPPIQEAQVGIDPQYYGTFVPDANVETVSVDGYAERGGANEVWATIRAGAGNINNDSGGTLVAHVISHANAGKWQGIRRAFMLFNIGYIVNAGSTILSAMVTLKPGTVTNDFGGSIVMCETNPNSNTAIAAADYQNVEDTAISDSIALADMTAGQEVVFTLNSTGRELIETQLADDGVVKIGFRLLSDLDNSEPTWVASKTDLLSVASADGTPDPVLALIWS
jgi:hypothetical protein